MLADPVEGFLSGLGSSFTRTLTGLAAIFLGFVICNIFAWRYFDVGILYEWVFYLFWEILMWGTYGVLFFLGLLSLVTMLAFLWFFISGHRSKETFFGAVTASVVYFSPMTSYEYRWAGALCLYIVFSIWYWILSGAIAKHRLERSEKADS